MAPRKQPTNVAEFPILDANGLYAGQIRGDGNCLFNALSDQLYGHQEEHKTLRDATIAHMRLESDFYRQYMIVQPVRRNPKRKTTVAPAPLMDLSHHTEEELQKQFDIHLDKMGQPGEWADNMEVSAFASALNVHVRLWQADFHYTFSPRIYYVLDGASGAVDDRPILNIAYHKWEHYSSVRNITGPHTGLPLVSTNILPSPSRKRSSVERDDVDSSIMRASKRRSPHPLFDSDSTPTCSESSSDESNGPQLSQSNTDELGTPEPEPALDPVPRPKLVLKLRCLKT
ncbi:cysteine proteinase [Aaosphaeria arxii CBS 175.79]|uniref:Cysteine proteinase n=1 Tax=Aaosphaeria arxii CBS 175.79 TaxID=1450172 RepID=A0A6A5Y4H7_9PLEO|nr:cysteine proteinase [Aaosphaeria arxii CBS 175.79]KAF2019937.1 cysteine proteinase [Aaosphaeria arxii CBS 175.79]